MSVSSDARISLPGLDLPRLEGWLLHHQPELLGDGALSTSLIAGGRSNLTYSLDGAASPLVLRRPPLGHVQSTAHDMAREFRVISALRDSAVPVPRAVLFVEDPAAGADGPFYLMQRMPGRTLSSRADNAAYSPAQLRRLSSELMGTLAALHTIDPVEIGLGDFGRPDGFLARQVERWGRQYDGSRSRSLPTLDELQEELRVRIPETRRSSIVHGDFRLDNALVTDLDGEPTISAILDWEMATLGDSLTDLGLFGLYWNINEVAGIPEGIVASSVSMDDGYPSFPELVAEYEDATGMTVPELPWYLGLAAFKLAVILEGIHFRYRAGQTVGDGFESIGSLVDPLARAGRRYLAEA
jgi:aminoglycoside phosphotransferase (APT) family kinase protein